MWKTICKFSSPSSHTSHLRCFIARRLFHRTTIFHPQTALAFYSFPLQSTFFHERVFKIFHRIQISIHPHRIRSPSFTFSIRFETRALSCSTFRSWNLFQTNLLILKPCIYIASNICSHHYSIQKPFVISFAIKFCYEEERSNNL